MNITKLSIVGYWDLVKFEAIADDGDIFLPFGQNVRGLLHYADNEIMSAQLGSTMRANFKNEDFRFGEDDEIREAFNGFISYFGKYSINENRNYIIHEVDLSLFPNWMNNRVKRFYEFDNGHLLLKAPQLEYFGIKRTPILTWKKIEDLKSSYRWHS